MDLRERRELRGLTQGELAREAGCTQTWINCIECGRKKPGQALLMKIESVLDGMPVIVVPVVSEDELAKVLHEMWLDRYV